MLQNLFFLAEVVGLVAFAASGAMLAAEKNLDIFGVWVLGMVTAFGGGVIRDLLLGITPPAMFSNYIFFLLATLTCCVVFLAYRFSGRVQNPKFDYRAVVNCFDAVGLGVFSVSGVSVAINAGYAANPLLAVTVGVVTGIGGGIIRDVLNGEIPSVLRKHVYALAAVIGAMLYYLLAVWLETPLLALPCGIAATFGIRMAATWYRWHLPRPLDRK